MPATGQKTVFSRRGAEACDCANTNVSANIRGAGKRKICLTARMFPDGCKVRDCAQVNTTFRQWRYWKEFHLDGRVMAALGGVACKAAWHCVQFVRRNGA
ncbi:MAG: hypothetical protein ABI552_18310 [Casimicrobiaceae bacterium]